MKTSPAVKASPGPTSGIPSIAPIAGKLQLHHSAPSIENIVGHTTYPPSPIILARLEEMEAKILRHIDKKFEMLRNKL